MWTIREEVKSAAKRLAISIQEVPVSQADEITDRVTTKFMSGTGDRFLWEKIIGGVSIHNRDAWEWINEFIGESEAVMFFNKSDEKKVFRFANGDDVSAVLQDTCGFEFYITDNDADYLLSYNHHDILTACGEAEKWLAKLRTKNL